MRIRNTFRVVLDMITTLDGILLDELERRTNSNYPSRFAVKWLHSQLTFGIETVADKTPMFDIR